MDVYFLNYRNRRGVLSIECLFVALCVFIIFCISMDAVAQTTSPNRLPDSSQVGRQKAEPSSSMVSLEDITFSIHLPPGADVPEAIAEEELYLDDVLLNGNEIYSDDFLKDLFKDFLKTDITFGDLYEIPNLIQEYYAGEGHVLSFAFFPPQEVSDGIYKVTIVEGYVDRVKVENASHQALKKKILKTLLPISQQRPFHLGKAEKYLLHVNSQPGVTVSAMLQPSPTQKGATELIATVSEVWGGVSATIENRNSAYIGPLAATVAATVNSPFGQGGQLQTQVMLSLDAKELVSSSARYEIPVTEEGTSVSVAGHYALTEPGQELDALDVEGEIFGVDLKMHHPVIRSRARRLDLHAGLSLQRNKVDLLNETLHRDRLHLLQAGAHYRQNGFLGGTSAVLLDVTQGLPIFGASKAGDRFLSRQDGQADFTKLTLDATHLQPLDWNFAMSTTVLGQFATKPVLALQEFGLGGARIGRGYDGGEITCDHGLGGSLELQYDYYVREPWLNRLQLYGFYDAGAVWDEDPAIKQQRTLASTGVGFRTVTDFGLATYLEYAKPLTRPAARADHREMDHRIYFGLNARY